AADPAVPIATILKRPQAGIGDARHARNARIPLPRDLYGRERRNSSGVEFGDRASLDALLAEVRNANRPDGAAPIIDGDVRKGTARAVISPIDGKAIGRGGEGDGAVAAAAMAAARAGFADAAGAGGGHPARGLGAPVEGCGGVLGDATDR